MKSTSVLRKCLIAVLGLCMLFFGAFMMTTATVSALTLGEFEMDLGAYVKLTGDGGLRMRVKMDATTKAVVDEDGNSLYFLLMNKAKFDAAEDAGVYDFSGYLTDGKTFTEDGYTKIAADKALIYYSGTDSCYYSNLLIYNIPDAYRATELCVVAFITDGIDAEFADFDAPSQVCKLYYEVLNAAALGEHYDAVTGIAGYTSWYGTVNYPLYAGSNDQYTVLQSEDLTGKYVDVADGVTRDNVFEAGCNAIFAETVDVNYDFDLSSASDYSAAIAGIDVNDINRLTLENGKGIAFTADGVNSELDFANATIQALGTGEKTLRVITDDAIYKVGITGATEIITTWARFVAVTKQSETTDYYILGNDITGGEVYASTRVSIGGVENRSATFKGVFDGRGYIVDGITFINNGYNNAAYNSGLIQALSGTLKNIGFTNLTVNAKNEYYGGNGSICYSLSGTIENVFVEETLKNLSASAKASGLFHMGNAASAKVKNCILKLTIDAESTGNEFCFGYAVSGDTIEDSYLINSDATKSITATYGDDVGCVKYSTDDAFFTAVTSLPAANGWSKYWSISAEGLNLVVENSDKNITDLFTWENGTTIRARLDWDDYGKKLWNGGETYKASANFVDVSAYQGKTLKILLPKIGNEGLAFYKGASQTDADRCGDAGWAVQNTTGETSSVMEMSITIPVGANYMRTTYLKDTYRDANSQPVFYAIVVGGQNGVRTVLANPAA